MYYNDEDENDEKFINLKTDKPNEVCKSCKEKCKQSCKVTVVYCPNKTTKGEKNGKMGRRTK